MRHLTPPLACPRRTLGVKSPQSTGSWACRLRIRYLGSLSMAIIMNRGHGRAGEYQLPFFHGLPIVYMLAGSSIVCVQAGPMIPAPTGPFNALSPIVFYCLQAGPVITAPTGPFNGSKSRVDSIRPQATVGYTQARSRRNSADCLRLCPTLRPDCRHSGSIAVTQVLNRRHIGPTLVTPVTDSALLSGFMLACSRLQARHRQPCLQPRPHQAGPCLHASLSCTHADRTRLLACSPPAASTRRWPKLSQRTTASVRPL